MNNTNFRKENSEVLDKKKKKPFGFDVEEQDFKKSEWSKNNPQTCVMIAIKEEGVAIRDSKDETKATQYFKHDEWDAFIKGVKSGQFDLK